MRWASSALLALASCNQIFGNADVSRGDAAFFDAHLDAPTSCAPVPAFSRGFVQVVAQNCISYTLSTTSQRAAALCLGAGNTQTIEVGDVGHELTSDPALSVTVSSGVNGVRISSDGERLTVGTLDTVDPPGRIALFHRAAGTWVRDADIATSAVHFHSVSEITTGPHPHVLVAYDSNDVRELVEQDDGTWLEVGRDRIVVAQTYGVHLSGDGLRTWSAVPEGFALYTRPDTDSAFTDAGVIGGTNGIKDLYLTDDCGAVYFSTLESIWAAPRR